MRPCKPYTPPADVESKLNDIFEKHLGSQSSELTNTRTKFKVLNACFKEFKHGIPNSRLHQILNTGKSPTGLPLATAFPSVFHFLIFHPFLILDQVKEFYKAAVDPRVPLDKFKSIELPPNLSIQYDYHRFHPETDTMFGGVSAFPQRSTIVTGLTYKKKYAGYTAKPKWH